MTHRFLPALVLAALPATAMAASCPSVPTPVVDLSYGSRYTDGSSSRSEFDAKSNAEVEKALKPIDKFISSLISDTNKVLSGKDRAKAEATANCVAEAIFVWAKANALSELRTMNAGISAPSRIGGIAMAWSQIHTFLPSDDPRRAVVERWLYERARATMTFFEKDAPPNASRNNLRAWAALAVARIGVSQDDRALTDWAARSVKLVVCDAGADGSLPREMARADLALHYQLHAIAPLVTTAALLDSKRYGLFSACNRAVPRAVDFTIRALKDPSIVQKINGKRQSYATGKDKVQAFELAWAVPYLLFVDSPSVANFVKRYKPLSNSKLGGSQDLLWSQRVRELDG